MLAKRYHTVVAPLPLAVEVWTWVHPLGGVSEVSDQ